MQILRTIIKELLTGQTIMLLLVMSGIYFTLRFRFFQFTGFKVWMKATLGQLFKQKEAKEGSVTPFQALTTALAATMGTGNMVGVATALVAGGPGAIFWMWVSAFFGMMTKYAEIVLSMYYRKRNQNGEWVGGPMYYIKAGLGSKFGWLSALFALFGSLAAFGIGNMTQVNSISTSLEALFVDLGMLSQIAPEGTFSLFKLIVGVIVAILASLVIIGGLKRISKVTEMLIPFLGIFYLFGAVYAISVNYTEIIPAFSSIFKGAFNFSSAAGGMLGYGIGKSMKYGIGRGIFSNEAGLGSAPIAHAAADTDSPVTQGMWGILEVFIDTIVMCTLTALVILTSGLFTGINSIDGAVLTIAAYHQSLGLFGSSFIAISIALFAFATVLSWYLYGQRCFEYFCKGKAIRLYQILYLGCIVLAAIMDLTMVWELSDILNNLMALPNIITLFLLSGTVIRISKNE